MVACLVGALLGIVIVVCWLGGASAECFVLFHLFQLRFIASFALLLRYILGTVSSLNDDDDDDGGHCFTCADHVLLLLLQGKYRLDSE